MRTLPRALLLLLPLLAASACKDPAPGVAPPNDTPLEIKSIQPDFGSMAGGSEVNVIGSGFQAGARLFLGEQEAQRVVVVNAYRIMARTAQAPAARVDVKVVNPDGKQAVLAAGFLYVDPSARTIVQAKILNEPRRAAIAATGATVTELVTGEVRVPGTTDGAGKGAGVRAQVGYAPATADLTKPESYIWSDAVYDTDEGAADRYKGSVPLQGPTSNAEDTREWALSIRFSVDDGATWMMADKDGGANGVNKDNVPRVVVSKLRVEWCKLGKDGDNATPLVHYKPGQTELLAIEAQVYHGGITPGAEQGKGITGEIGWGPANEDPRTSDKWKWSAAEYKKDVGNNDTYEAKLPHPGPDGFYKFAFRFHLVNGGTRVCDANGHNDTDAPLTYGKLGNLYVSVDPPKLPVTWCKLGENDPVDPETVVYARDQEPNKTIFAQVYMKDVTDKVGAGAELKGQLGWGPDGTDPQTSPLWKWDTQLVFNRDQFQVNDEWKGTLPNPGLVGKYRFAVRFQVGTSPYRVCDSNGHNDEDLDFDLSKLGIIDVQGEITPPTVVGYCKLGPDGNPNPESVEYALGQQASRKVVGNVYVQGATEGAGQGAGVLAELGYGPDAEDPTTSANWTWVAGAYKGDLGSANDEYEATLPNPNTKGTYRFAWRFKANTGAYLYCDSDGHNSTPELPFDRTKLGNLSVVDATNVTVSWCRLGGQEAQPPPNEEYRLGQAATKAIYAQVYKEGVTDRAGANADLLGELGWGPATDDPTTAGTWTWAPAAHNTDIGNNDEYQATLPNPGVVGSYKFAYRFRLSTSSEYRYCDADGLAEGGFTLAQAGNLTVKPVDVDDCRLLGPNALRVKPGTQTPSVIGIVRVMTVTDATSPGAGADIVAEVGYGPRDSTNPAADAGWVWSSASFSGEDDSKNYDTYAASFSAPSALGTYAVAMRFRYGANGQFSYCDLDGKGNGYQADKAAVLTVSEEVLPMVDWCKLGPADDTTPPTHSYFTDEPASKVILAQVFKEGLTNVEGAGANVQAQLGWGPAAEDPRTSSAWNWNTAATFKGDSGNNDEYQATLPNPGTAGTYKFAYRVRIGSGEFRYCDADGSNDTNLPFDTAKTGTLSVSVAQRAVGYCKLGPVGNTTPESVRYTPTQTANRVVVASVWVDGVTRGTGAGKGVEAELGWGPENSDPRAANSTWNWQTKGAWKADLGDNDEFQATLPHPGALGTYKFAYRFRVNGGDFLYCDADGVVPVDPQNELTFDLAKLGTLTVEEFDPPTAIGYCKLGPDGNKVPETVQYALNQTANRKVVAQVFALDVTQGAGQGSGMVAELGQGPEGQDPRTSQQWTWTAAAYKGDIGNDNDEYDATLPNPGVAGTTRFAYRFRLNGGSPVYCDADGFVPATAEGELAFDVTKLGTLTVSEAPPKPPVDWCKLGQDGQNNPETVNYALAQVGNKTVYAQVNMPGVTDQPGAGVGLSGQLGYGPADSDPRTSAAWNWNTQLSFNQDQFTVNDEWKATLPNPGAVGAYKFAVRFSVNGGPMRVCDSDGHNDTNSSFDLAKLGTLNVVNEVPLPSVIGYCKLGPDANKDPESVTYALSQTADRKVVAQVYAKDVTEGSGQGAGMVAEIGYGLEGQDPTGTNWTWTPAAFKGDFFSNDEYEVVLPNPGTAGAYRFAYRFRVNGGAYLYCDANGVVPGATEGEQTFDTAKLGALTVTDGTGPTTIGACKMGPEFDTTPEAVTYTVGQPGNHVALAQVFVQGVTNATGAGATIEGALGWGPANEDVLTSANWKWDTQGSFKADGVGGDEYQATLPHPGVAGAFKFAWRFRVNGGAWRYCDADGNDGSVAGTGAFDATKVGALTVNPAPPPTAVGYCKLGEDGDNRTPVVHYLPTATNLVLFKGQVYVNTVTEAAGKGAGVVAEFGYGPANADPRSAATWSWVQASYRGDLGGNDEYLATLSNPGAVGTYKFAYRFQVNGGAWRYCDADGHNDTDLPFDLTKLGSLTVADETPKPPVTWCKLGEVDKSDPETVTYNVAQAANRTVYAQVYMKDVTDTVGAGTGLSGQLGWGPANEDPRTSAAWNWNTQLSFNQDRFNVNDEWKATLPNPGAVGTYKFAVRFSVNGGTVRVCDSDGHNDENLGFDLTKLGTLNVVNEVPLPTAIGYCKLGPDGNKLPENVRYAPRQPADRKVVAQVYAKDVTEGSGRGAGMVAELGYGLESQDPTGTNWTWTAATFKGDIGNNDEYELTLPNPGTVGAYKFAYRFRLNGGETLYCDADGVVPGVTEGEMAFDTAKLSVLSVTDELGPTVIGSCKMGPELDTSREFATYTERQTPDYVSLAQVFVQGVTDVAGANDAIEGALGWGPADADVQTSSLWTWRSQVAFKRDGATGDEYHVTLPNPGFQGAFKFAWRFRVNGGAWRYCDADGSDGSTSGPGAFDPARIGTLTVNPTPLPTKVDWCKLGETDKNDPETVTYEVAQAADKTVLAQVYIQGVTERFGAGEGLSGQLGWGPANEDPRTSAAWNWNTQLTFNQDRFNANDEWKATLPNPGTVGAYKFAVRFSLNGGTVRVCDSDGHDDGAGFELAKLGTLNVVEEVPLPTAIGYCKLGPDGNKDPESVTYALNQTADRKVVAQVYANGATPGAGAGAGMVAEIGYGPEAEDPKGAGWTWTPAAFKGDIGNNDEYELTLPNPGTAGTYKFTYRFRLNGGETLYCDADGVVPGVTEGEVAFDMAKLGTLTVTQEEPPPPPTTIGACKMGPEFDTTPEAVTYTVGQPGNHLALAQVFVQGVTNGTGAGATIEGALGWGPADEDVLTSANWKWDTQGSFKADGVGGDEYQATLPHPGVAGAFKFAWRFRVNGGAWRYCDADGNDGSVAGTGAFDATKVGALTVNPAPPPPPPTAIGYCKLGPDGNTTPESVTYTTAQVASRKVVAQVYVDTVTNGAGAGLNVVAELGYGPQGEAPATSNRWTWGAANFRGDIGNNDEYEATLPNPGVVGDYTFAYRFRVNGGAYVHCDADGVDGSNPFDAAKAGTLSVVAEPPPLPTQVGWCKLGPIDNGSPETVNYSTTQAPDRLVLAQVYAKDVTEAPGAGAGMVAEIGYGPEAEDPTTSSNWRWSSATFKGDAFNSNDEFETTLPNPNAPGRYKFTYRFRLNGGAFFYCDSDGHDAGNPFDTAKLGTLIVSDSVPLPTAIGYCKLGPDGQKAPESVGYTYDQTAAYKVVAQVYADGVTAGAGAGAGMVAELGYGPEGQDPHGSAQWTWAAAAYKGDFFNNDEYEATLPNPGTAGTYRFAYRFRLNGGQYLYCDADGVVPGATEGEVTFDMARLGTLTVTGAPPPTVIGSCKMGPEFETTPSSVTYTIGQPGAHLAVAQVFVEGVTASTGEALSIWAELGWGPAGTAPHTRSWNWDTQGSFKADGLGGDEYQATLPNPGYSGNFQFAWRFSINGGHWRYCDADGSDGSASGTGAFDVEKVGTLTVNPAPPPPPTKVEWCKLGPIDTNSPETVNYSTTQEPNRRVLAQVYAPDVTNGTGAGAGMVAEIGYGPEAEDPTTSSNWRWSRADFKRDFFDNDEFEATLPNPNAVGRYKFAYRFQLNGGARAYCDSDGANGANLPFDTAKLGTLIVSATPVKLPVTWCKLGMDGQNDPELVTYAEDQAATKAIYAQVYMQGVTDKAGAGAGLTGQLGWGPRGEDPRTSSAWNWGTPLTFNQDRFDSNDEWMATLPNPAVVGAYAFAVRFQVDGGPIRVCDSDGHNDEGLEFSLDRLGTLHVVDEVPQPTAIGYCKLGPDGNQTPETVTYAGDEAASRKVVAQVYAEGVTAGLGAGAGMVAELGYGPEAQDPRTSAQWRWVAAAFKGDIGNNDEFDATLPNPRTEGTYRFAYRFRLNGGETLYCDADGVVPSTTEGELTFDTAKLGTLTITPPVNPPPTIIGFCKMGSESETTPESATYTEGQPGTHVSLAHVYVENVTDGWGESGSIDGALGWGPAGEDPRLSANWTWSARGTFQGDALLSDAYQATLPHPGMAGSFRFTWRFRVNGGAWQYCDADGTDGSAGGTGAFDPANIGTLTVNPATPPAPTRVEWCKLGPIDNTSPEGVVYLTTQQAHRKVLAQVYATDVTGGQGPGAGMVAEIGYGPSGMHPNMSAWKWSPASYKGDYFSNDEFEATLPNPGSANTYAFTYRFRLNGGQYLYCDADGVTDTVMEPFDVQKLGTLWVQEPWNATVDYCKLGPAALTTPESYSYLVGQQASHVIVAQVYATSVTEGAGAGSDLTAELGWGPSTRDPRDSSGGWTWTAAAYRGDIGNNDEFLATLPNPGLAGNYQFTYRFRRASGPWMYCDADGVERRFEDFDPAKLSTLTVNPPPSTATAYCRLQTVSSPTITSGTKVTVVGRVNLPNVTNGAGTTAGLRMQVGVGNANTDASIAPGAFTWKDAAYLRDPSDEAGTDEFSTDIHPAYTGNRTVSARYTTDNGATWTYCDQNSGDAYKVEQQYGLSVGNHQAFEYCNLQWPFSINVAALGTTVVYGQVYKAGLTNTDDGPGAGLVAELGYGDASQDPGVAGWTWMATTFHEQRGGNDEFKATLPSSLPAGTSYMFRYTAAGGPTCYGDRADRDASLNGVQASDLGTVVP
jgi:hypothetical protein